MPDENRHHDADLVRIILDGGPASDVAADTLIKRHYRDVHGFIYKSIGNREASEDLVQEVFLAAIKTLDRLDKPESFRAWAFGVAGKQVWMWKKRAGRCIVSTVETDDSVLETEPAPEDRIDMEALGTIKYAIAKLPASSREVINLVYFDHLTITQIAQQSNVSDSAVCKRLARAHSQLSKMFANPWENVEVEAEEVLTRKSSKNKGTVLP